MLNRNGLFNWALTSAHQLTGSTFQTTGLWRTPLTTTSFLPGLRLFQSQSSLANALPLKMLSLRDAFDHLTIPTRVRPTVAQLLLAHQPYFYPEHKKQNSPSREYAEVVASQLEKIINTVHAKCQNNGKAIQVLKSDIELLELQKEDFESIVSILILQKADVKEIHDYVPIVKNYQSLIEKCEAEIYLLNHPEEMIYKKLGKTGLSILNARISKDGKLLQPSDNPFSFDQYKALVLGLRDKLQNSKVLKKLDSDTTPYNFRPK
jgi:hypothetical protein